MDSNSLESVEETTPKKSSNLLKIIIGVALTLLAILTCGGVVAYLAFGQMIDRLPAIDLTGVTTPALSAEPARNHIAYIGNDNNVWIVSPDDQRPRHITTDGRDYRFPTWAPDGRQLAFIGPDENDDTVLYISTTTVSSPTILFEDAQAAPFYLYWAPDSQTITFLTQESSGLAMRQASTTRPNNNRVLEEGAPFYWVWSPLGDKLLMHVGGARSTSEEAHISLLDNRAEAERVQLDLAPGQFQAPVWSTDGKYFFYIAENEQELESIYKTEADTLAQTVVTNLSGFAYLALSPDDRHIAYLQIERGNRPPFGTAYLVNTDGSQHRQISDRSVGSMYWSPDGRKLALLTLAQRDDGSSAKLGGLAAPLPQEISLRWWVYEVETDELEPLISFNPTAAFLQTVPYFDQYHLSLTFWSPDSRYFVITKEKFNRNNEGTIWVLDTTGEEEPRQIGEGRLAVWSWQ